MLLQARLCVSALLFDGLWSVRKSLLLDTQNPEIAGFSTAHAYKYKTKWQAKMQRKQQKNDIFVD